MRLALPLLATLVLSAAASAANAPVGGSTWLAETKALRTAAPDAEAKAVVTNPSRAYPPSCLSNPLPTTPKGPATVFTQSLADIDGNEGGFNGQFGYFETVTVRVWRQACSNNKSAVIVSFERAGNKANTFPAPDVPAPWATLSGGALTPIRLVAEPNTWQAYDGGNTIYYAQQSFVLDLIPGYLVDLNQAFTLSLDTVNISGQTVRSNFSIPAYNPATNPDASLALEITGYNAGAYYDTAHGGEGILFDVGERTNGTRFAFFAWFTYDKQGFPYWIVGNADVPAGARTITIPALVFDQGGFAGAFTPPLPSQSWGTVTFTFPSCNALTLQFASTLQSNSIPTGNGIRAWSRLTGVNGFGCE